MPEDGAFIGKCVCEGIGFEIFEKETDQNREIAERITPLAALPRFRPTHKQQGNVRLFDSNETMEKLNKLQPFGFFASYK